jgi:L-lactate dehydrogenase complex protein LldG
MNSRANILARVRSALQTPIDEPIVKPLLAHNPFLPLPDEPLEVCFAERLQQNGGTFFFCESLEDFLAMLKKWLAYRKIEVLFAEEAYLQALLQVASIDYEMNDVLWEQAQVGMVLAEMLVAETGSIIISSKRASGRKWVTFPPIQIVVAFTSQILPTLAEALQAYHTKYADNFPSMLSVITAPSQTADIERTVVMGAHGAKELVVFLIEESVES